MASLFLVYLELICQIKHTPGLKLKIIVKVVYLAFSILETNRATAEAIVIQNLGVKNVEHFQKRLLSLRS